MLALLIEHALRQRLMTLLAAAALLAAGWWSWQQTPVDAFPDVSTPQIKVIIKAPGMTPEEVETRIAGPVEREMLGIPNVRILRSTSKYALADVTVDFEESTDIYWARGQVDQRLRGIWGDLPAGITGGVAPLTTPLGEMYMFVVEGEQYSLAERRALLDWVIRPALRSVPGVADVNALGGHVTTFEVVPDPVRMAGLGISLEALAAALERNNQNSGAGRLVDGESVLLVRTEGAVTALADLEQIVVRADRIEPVRVVDIASVRLGSLARYGGVTRNGVGEAVQGLVLGLRGANARDVVAGVEAKLETLNDSLPEGVTLRPFYNRADLVDRAIGMIQSALFQSIVFVIVMLMVFLGDWRAALSVAVVLPLAAMATFVLMHQFGLSANLMSLGGLVIAIGMLVDGSIVVVENAVSHLSTAQAQRLPRLHLIYRAASEVAVPVTAGIGIISLVFMPLLSLQGLEGKLFRPVAMTIVFALVGSLVLGLTVIPVISAMLLRQSTGEPAVMRSLQRAYERLLEAALTRVRSVMIAAGVLLVLALVAWTQVGKTFMPTMDEGNLIVQLAKLPSISLEESLDIDLAFQQRLLSEVPEVEGVVARTGSDEIGLDPMGLNETDTFLVLAPIDQWREPDPEFLRDRIREVLADFPGVATTFTQPIQMRVDEMLTGVRGDVAVKIFGDDPAALSEAAKQIRSAVSALDGASDVYSPARDGQQFMVLAVNRLAAGRFGLDVDTLSDVIRSQLEGLEVGRIYRGDRRQPLVIRGSEKVAASPQRLTDLLLTLPDGQRVPLSTVATINVTEGPVAVTREQGSRLAHVIANVVNRDLVGFVEEAKSVVATLDLPAGVYLEWGGEFENQQRAATRLAAVVPVTLALVFLILFVTLGSVKQAGLVLGMIPLALVGGVFALAVSGEYLSVPASVGFIALLGIAVMNGVVLMTHFNYLLARGVPLERVVREGAARRLRPVLTTATITAVGLVPLVFASGPGAEVQRPLAIVVIGGVLSSTLLTLVMLPLLYRWLHRKEAQ